MADTWNDAPQSDDSPQSDPASASQRSALLSPPYNDGVSMMIRPRHASRGPGERFRRERERIHSGSSTRELIRLLVNEEYEGRQTRKVLYTAFDRLENEARRAAEAEGRALETIQKFRVINEARVAAQQEASRAQEELQLYKLQLENAQKEIFRAQDTLRIIEAQRDDAEAAAARARTQARKLREDRVIDLAREEGRRLGFEEGLRRGRNLGYQEGVDQTKEVATRALDRLMDEQGLESDTYRDDFEDRRRRAAEIAEPPDVQRIASPRPSAAMTDRDSLFRDVQDARGLDDDRRQMDPVDSIRPPSVSRNRRSPQPVPIMLNPSVTTQSSRAPRPTPWPVSERPGSRSEGRRSAQPTPVALPSDTSQNIPLQQPDSWNDPERAPSRSSRRFVPPPSAPSVASQGSRLDQPPWPTDDRPDRPISVQNSPLSIHHEQISVPPDGYIPTLGADSFISLPPPHELQRDIIPSPEPPSRAASPQPPSRGGSPNVRAREFITEPNYPIHRRASPESQASTKISHSSTISQLDLVSLPNLSSKRRDRPHGLSVIHEDAERPSSYLGTAPHSRSASRDSFRQEGDTESLQRRDRQSLADSLRYSDPSEVEEWRRHGAESARSQSSREGPPRPRPRNVTTPSPLSPPSVAGDMSYLSPRHRRSRSEMSAGGTPFVRHRRARSSDSSVPEITIQPPSGPPSDSADRHHNGTSYFLSPDHQSQPLPVRAPGSYAPTVPNTPTTAPMNMPEHIQAILPDGQLPPGFQPTGATSRTQTPVIPGGVNMSHPPALQPGGTPRHQNGFPPSPSLPFLFEPPPVMPMGPNRPITPRSPYSHAPGVLFPEQSGMRSATPSGVAPGLPLPPSPRLGSPRSQSSMGEHRRSNSLNAGMTPATLGRLRHLSTPSNPTLSKKPSNASLSSRRSYSRYDPGTYNDPAFFGSRESLVDGLTNANTMANAAGRSPRMRPVSPSLSYVTNQSMD